MSNALRPVTAAADPRFHAYDQFAIAIPSDACCRIAPKGSTALCVEISDTMQPSDGDLVLVHRMVDDGPDPFIEMSLKRYRVDRHGPLLVSESDYPAFHETLRLDPSVLITAVVVRIDRPLPR